MLKNEFHISKLISAHLQGSLTDAERFELNEWINSSDDHLSLWEQLNEHDHVAAELQYFTRPDKAKIWNKLQLDLSSGEKRPKLFITSLFFRVAVAAVVLVTLSVGLFYFNKSPFLNGSYDNDIPPGKMGATLTLGNGKKIRLSETGGGELAREAGITISKGSKGQITYHIDQNSGENLNVMNTLSTDRGETYILILPDQSKIYMNAASSLTYSPSLLKEGIRHVKLSGEAYFEVAKDKLHPFIVESQGQQVEVLGTHFNISAYQDDHTASTTLLEGVVKVSASGAETRILMPNQQSISGPAGISVKNVVADSFADWKNGVFSFEGEGMQSIMKKVARWYNVEVVYEGTENDRHTFSGTISRSANISEVLETLDDISNMKFRIEGRRVIVAK